MCWEKIRETTHHNYNWIPCWSVTKFIFLVLIYLIQVLVILGILFVHELLMTNQNSNTNYKNNLQKHLKEAVFFNVVK